MGFYAIVLKNLLRRPIRSLLTVTGIAIGIGAVVALTSIAWGFEKTWIGIYTARGTDLIVTKAGSLNPVPAAFPGEAADDLRALPYVAQGSGVLSDVVSIEEVPIVLVFAWESQTFLWDHLRLVSGRWPADDKEAAVVLGTVAADVLNKTVGSPIQIQTTTFTVSGVFESASLPENGSVVMTLPRLQGVTGQTGKVNFVNLKLAQGTTADEIASLRRSITTRWPEFKVFPAGEVGDQNAALQMVKAMSLGHFRDRARRGRRGRHEHHADDRVRAPARVRYPPRRGLAPATDRVLMILYESLSLSLAGGVLGFVAGLAAVEVLEMTPLLRGKIEGESGVLLFGVALAIAISLGVMGGVYPAYRGSCMRPSDALRHE